MTSTLQQEASRKYGMGAKVCMSAAQRLYEAGHITYMRTDGIDMAPEAVMAARDAIKTLYGAPYLPDAPRMYKNKAKNAQEAHECIRPTEMLAAPDTLKLAEADQRKLYDLIWKRTIASQMAAARLERTTVDIGSRDEQVELRATGQVVLFDGFLKVYEEGRDEDPDDDDKRLPQIAQGEPAEKRGVTPEQHFTQAPPRYTEASLVKRMEELGIGRPSTYASIVTTIQDRDYVRKDQNRLIPEDKGRLVTVFLMTYFAKYVGYDFTADLEDQLDDVSAGNRNWRDVLDRFWRDFTAALAETADLRIGEVLHQDRRGPGPASLSAPRRRRRSADLPDLRRRPAEPEDRPLGRRLHRLLELSELPLHPQSRRLGRRRRSGRGAASGRRSGRSDRPESRPVRALRPARRGRPRRSRNRPAPRCPRAGPPRK